MTPIQNRIDAFAKLGDFLRQFSRREIIKNDFVVYNDLFFDDFQHQIQLAQRNNSWFTKNHILYAIECWSEALKKDHLVTWISNENLHHHSAKKVAIIMAGNIPLVGFHDFLSVLITGHTALIKQSSNDKDLLPFLAKYLSSVDSIFKKIIVFTEEQLKDYDAVIATGNDFSANQFKKYFNKFPNIIRQSRHSVAIINGKESSND